MATASNEIDDIRRQMAKIRRELHEDIQNVVAGAEAVTDWRHYVRLYPWTCVSLAVAIGYLIVPKRHRTVVEKVTTVVPVPVEEAIEAPAKKEKRAGIAGMLFGLLSPIAMRAAQNYASHYIENWIAQQRANLPGFGGSPQAHPRQPGAPGL